MGIDQKTAFPVPYQPYCQMVTLPFDFTDGLEPVFRHPVDFQFSDKKALGTRLF